MSDQTGSLSSESVFGSAAPSTVGRYEVRGLLGQGGMGAVYLGFDRKLSREVAIKVITVEQQGDATLRQRFHREARAIALLHHQNIVEVLDYSGQDARAPFLVMERLTGRTLEYVLRQGVLTEAQALAIGYELAGALAHAHDKGIVHRDIKPENVFIEPSGRLVVTDFGIAKGVGRHEETCGGKGTQSVGTPLFASPEQLTEPEAVGPRSDLYALGSLLYYALSSEFPYPTHSLLELLAAQRRHASTPVGRRTHVSVPLEALVMRLLQADPAARPHSAHDVQRTLHTLLEKAQVFDLKAVICSAYHGELVAAQSTRVVTVPQTTVKRRLPPLPPSRVRWYAAITALLLAAAVATVVSLRPNTQPLAAPPSPPPPAVQLPPPAE